MKKSVLISATLFSAILVQAQGINWPTNQLLPTFSTPAGTIDCIDVSSASPAEIDLFSSLEGIVNRTQPRIACANSIDGEGKFTWLNLHNLPYTLINGYSAITKYQSSVNGLVVTDPNMPDTLNLATTIAGVSNLLICDPSLLTTLTNAPYNLAIGQDLRGQFSSKYQVYGYLYTNYWPQCTHRMITGLYTNIHGELRDYDVAVKSAVVWLDPGTANFQDKAILSLFLNNMTAVNGIYMGWWPSEGNGLGWIAQYGIPVLASDYFQNASLFSGVTRPINVPDIPPPPPLQNKIYVSLILSDGDNIQYMQHVMKMDWDKTARGSVPIGWTVSPLAAEFDPVMLNHFWNTATTNDCLISGPSGAGYAHIESWNAANLAAFARISDSYLQRGGLRVITMWDQVTTGVARAFATNCPALFGLTDQSGGTYTATNLGQRTIGLTVSYSSSTNDIITGITNAAQSWNGTSPMFLAAQAVVWSLGPGDLRNIANTFDTNKFIFVRPDHLFMLYNQLLGMPVAITKSVSSVGTNSATLPSFVIPNAVGAGAWFEWGTNSSYGNKSTMTNVYGGSMIPVNVAISGLAPGTTYHYRIAVSNALGIVRGGEKVFTIGGRVKVWGDGSLGQTNVPPGLTNVIRVSTGASHALALKNDGTVVVWGYNAFKQTNVPPAMSNVVEVSGGVQHSLALNASGAVAAWGDNSFGQTNVPPGLSNVVEIAAGGYHNLALKSDGTITAWGYNNLGQTNVPAGLSNVVGIAAGRYHSLALKMDGTVTAWGNNSYSQANVPAGLGRVVAIAAGDYHSLALKTDDVSTNLSPARKWVADNLAGADGSAVAGWPDSILGVSATQTSAGNRPKLYSNVLNGHKTVRFASASSQYLTIASTNSPISAAGSFTLIVVFKTSTAGNSSGNFYLNTGLLATEQPGVVADWALCINGSQLGAGLGSGGSGCGTDFSLYGGNVTDGNPHIAMYARSGDAITLSVDGVIVAAQSALCPAARGDYPVQIGAMAPALYCFNGDIAEIQMFDRALNSKETASVNEMLATAYGIGGSARRVVAWGNNSNGQASAPDGLTNLTAIAGGGSFNLASRNDGSAFGWGMNNSAQTNLLPGLTNVSAVSGGLNFALAIGNQIPQITNAAVAGYVNHDLTLALPAVDPDGNPLSFRVLALPGSGALYQYSGGSRGSPISAPNTPVNDAAGQIIFAPATNGTGNPYANFNFMAGDTFYNSSSAQMTVNIALPAVPQFGNASWNSSGGNFGLNFSGSSNATYSVWASTDLSGWIKIGSATEASPGQYQFTDTSATNSPQRFYRTSAP